MTDVQENLDRLGRELALENYARQLNDQISEAHQVNANLLDQIDWQDKKLEKLSKRLQALAVQSEELMNDRYRYNAQLEENQYIKRALENEEALVSSLNTRCSELRAQVSGFSSEREDTLNLLRSLEKALPFWHKWPAKSVTLMNLRVRIRYLTNWLARTK